jgi:hypothetical protein
MSNIIPNTFRHHGWNYKLVRRTAHVAIYSQSMHPDLPDNGKAAAYEIARIRTREAATITMGGVTREVQAGEYLPTDREWGRFGWTAPTLERAEQKAIEVEFAVEANRRK